VNVVRGAIVVRSADGVAALAEVAVDASVVMLDSPGAPGAPGHVEEEQVGAVVLQVHALPRGIGGDEDAQRVLGSALRRL
jgi:hypothetical protein